ncbi:MAG: AbrB/MazE/SpoVT family DNA-binding domain-containing protein [Candidatus Aenigmarchaeota archaeon]|nr:AbrB/MazE/SpoVT family DNA-binding domain-containing protein [Candidatus Aenigmarchaeota archaeon]
MEIEISKVGERGQVVIPQEFREELQIKKGEKFIVFRSEDKLIFQQMKRLKAKIIEQLKEDMVDVKIAERRLKEIEKGQLIVQTKDEFLRDMKKWVKI